MFRNIWIFAAIAIPAFAQFTPISTPGASYTGVTTVVPITGANLSTLTSLSSGSQTLTFSSSMSARTVPGGNWGSWGSPPATESATPRVLFTPNSPLTVSLSAPTTTFGFEIEPNSANGTVTATFMNNATTVGTITRPVNWSAGAVLVAATSTTPITSVVISLPSTGGFAVGQLRFAAPPPAAPVGVPALGDAALAALAVLLMASASFLAWRQKRAL